MDVARLRGIPLFEGLTDDELGALAGKFQEISVYPGTRLAKDGEFGYRFFIVDSGTAKVYVGGEEVMTLGPGDFFGEIALAHADRRTADVEAETAMNLLTLLIWDFNEMVEAYPAISERIDAVRSEREGHDD